MPEALKLTQPNRTWTIRGFSDRGASGALHSTTASGGVVTGHFQDQADFCVLVVHDADDWAAHRRLKYLSVDDFTGKSLAFDLRYTGLLPLDSPKFPTIDSPFLDLALSDGTSGQIKLFDYATLLSGSYSAATASVTVELNGALGGDALSVWIQNVAFSYTATGSETAADVALSLANSINAAAWNTFLPTLAVRAIAVDDRIDLTAARYGTVNTNGTAVTWAGNDKFSGLAVGDAITINGTATTVAAVASPTSLTVASDLGAQSSMAYTAARGGVSGNFLRLPVLASAPSRLALSADPITFAGGSSDATWHISLDFDALGFSAIRQAWFTFAPPLTLGAALPRTEWSATFTNWTLSGGNTALKVADPLQSCVVEHHSIDATYSGTWTDEVGFYSHGFAKSTSTPGDALTLSYTAQGVHDLYLGTALYSDRGQVSISIDGAPPATFENYLAAEPQVITRRRIATALAAGSHTVTITLLSSQHAASTGTAFYFDYLHAVVEADVPDAPESLATVTAAHDFDTEVSGYRQSPERVMWMMDKLGLDGPGNMFVGVFWHLERRMLGQTLSSAAVTFGGSFAANDQIFLTIGGSIVGKTVFAEDTNATIATHFAHFINEVFVGVYAEAVGDVLTIYTRSAASAFAFTLASSYDDAGGGSGTIATAGSLDGSVAGTWVIDDAYTPPLNPGAVAWFAAYFKEWAARNRTVSVALSMELVDPDDDPAAGKVFAARYPDNVKVETATGFGTLKSTHCVPEGSFRPFIQRVYLHIAELMLTAGLPIHLQFGETLWWFFTNYDESTNPAGGMAFYDDATATAATALLGRPLVVFRDPDDAPSDHQADADFLRERLENHVATLAANLRTQPSLAGASITFELLYPLDVNKPVPAGAFDLGGALNAHVNFAASWTSPATAPFEQLTTEGLDDGSGSRDLELARATMDFPVTGGRTWPRSGSRHFIAIFNGGCPWQAEYILARRREISTVVFWAFDQFCLLSWPVGEPKADRFAEQI